MNANEKPIEFLYFWRTSNGYLFKFFLVWDTKQLKFFKVCNSRSRRYLIFFRPPRE